MSSFAHEACNMAYFCIIALRFRYSYFIPRLYRLLSVPAFVCTGFCLYRLLSSYFELFAFNIPDLKPTDGLTYLITYLLYLLIYLISYLTYLIYFLT